MKCGRVRSRGLLEIIFISILTLTMFAVPGVSAATKAKKQKAPKENVPLEIKFSKTYDLIWDDTNSGAESAASIWRVKITTKNGYARLGDIAVSGHEKPGLGMPLIMDDPAYAAKPVDYTMVWSNKNIHDPSSCRAEPLSLWYPRAPDGFVAMGLVAVKGYSKPSLDLVRCVRDNEYYVDKAADLAGIIWSSRSTGVASIIGIWGLGEGADVQKQKKSRSTSADDTLSPGTFLIGSGLDVPMQFDPPQQPHNLRISYKDLKQKNKDKFFATEFAGVEAAAKAGFYKKNRGSMANKLKKQLMAEKKERLKAQETARKKQEKDIKKEQGKIKKSPSKDDSDTLLEAMKKKKQLSLLEIVDYFVKTQIELDSGLNQSGIKEILSDPRLQILTLRNARIEVGMNYIRFIGKLYLWDTELGQPEIAIEQGLRPQLTLYLQENLPDVFEIGPFSIKGSGNKGGPTVGVGYGITRQKVAKKPTLIAAFDELFIDGRTSLFTAYLDARIDLKMLSRMLFTLSGNLADGMEAELEGKLSIAMLIDPKKFGQIGFAGEFKQSFMSDVTNLVKSQAKNAPDEEIEIFGIPTKVSLKEIMENFQWPINITRASFEVTTDKLLKGIIPGVIYKGTVFGEPALVNTNINLDDVSGGKFTAAKEFVAKLFTQAYKEAEKLSREIAKAAAPYIKAAEKAAEEVAKEVVKFGKDTAELAEDIADETVKMAEKGWSTVEKSSKAAVSWFTGLFAKKKKKKPSKPSKQKVWKKPYFFRAERYVRFNMMPPSPGIKVKADERYPKDRSGKLWPGIQVDKVPAIDAAMAWGGSKAYFFVGDKYYRYNVDKDKVDSGYPKKIQAAWKKMPFNRIDAAFYNWDSHNAYFFSGDKYVRWSKGKGIDKGYPKKIKDHWKGIPFKKIDAAVSWVKMYPKGGGFGAAQASTKVYFFSCDQYVRYDMGLDKVDPGYPKPIRGNWEGMGFNKIDAAMDAYIPTDPIMGRNITEQSMP